MYFFIAVVMMCVLFQQTNLKLTVAMYSVVTDHILKVHNC
jgi:hypothetical protein